MKIKYLLSAFAIAILLIGIVQAVSNAGDKAPSAPTQNKVAVITIEKDIFTGKWTPTGISVIGTDNLAPTEGEREVTTRGIGGQLVSSGGFSPMPFIFLEGIDEQGNFVEGMNDFTQTTGIIIIPINQLSSYGKTEGVGWEADSFFTKLQDYVSACRPLNGICGEGENYQTCSADCAAWAHDGLCNGVADGHFDLNCMSVYGIFDSDFVEPTPPTQAHCEYPFNEFCAYESLVFQCQFDSSGAQHSTYVKTCLRGETCSNGECVAPPTAPLPTRIKPTPTCKEDGDCRPIDRGFGNENDWTCEKCSGACVKGGTAQRMCCNN